MTSPADLLLAAATADPARPLVTFYDDATGERVELSVATFSNWVSKTANLLQEELDLGLGSTVGVRLPAHWQAHVVVMAAWRLGCVVVPGDVGNSVDLVVTGPAPEPSPAAATLALAMRPLGLGYLTTPPAPVLDYGSEVLAQGDVFSPWVPVPPGSPLLRSESGLLDGDALVAAASAAWPLDTGARLLTDAAADDETGVLLLLAVLAAGGSLVLCGHLDAAAVPARRGAERVTAVVAAAVP